MVRSLAERERERGGRDKPMTRRHCHNNNGPQRQLFFNKLVEQPGAEVVAWKYSHARSNISLYESIKRSVFLYTGILPIAIQRCVLTIVRFTRQVGTCPSPHPLSQLSVTLCSHPLSLLCSVLLVAAAQYSLRQRGCGKYQVCVLFNRIDFCYFTLPCAFSSS